MRVPHLALAFTCVARATLAAQAPTLDSSAVFPQLEQLLAADVATQHIPGVAVAFVDAGRISYAHGFGVADVATGRLVTAEMLFRVGSVSKPIAAYTVIAEARARGISLDAPIGSIVHGLSPKLASVTLAQLLSHTAGIREIVTAVPVFDHPDERELVGQLRTWSDTLLFADPGDVESYSNPGFVLAGAVIESVAGLPFSQLVARRVFAPLGMEDATYASSVAVTRPHSDGYSGPRNGEPRLVRPVLTDARHLPPTMVWASARDLARFAIALENHGRIDGRQALDSSIVDLMMQPRATLPSAPRRWYGYGLFVTDESPVRRVSHGGRIDGYAAALDMAPSQGRAFVVLSNRLDAFPTHAMAALLDAELGTARVGERMDSTSAPATWTTYDIAGHYVNGDWSLDVRDSAGVALLHGRISPTSDVVRDLIVSPAGADRLALRAQSGVGPAIPAATVLGARSGARYIHLGERALRRVIPVDR